MTRQVNSPEAGVTIFNGMGRTGWSGTPEGRGIEVLQNGIIVVHFTGQNTPSHVVKAAASHLAPKDVDFATASSESNPWYYVQLRDKLDGSKDSGAGVTISATTAKAYEIDDNLIRTVCFHTTRTTGDISGTMYFSDRG